MRLKAEEDSARTRAEDQARMKAAAEEKARDKAEEERARMKAKEGMTAKEERSTLEAEKQARVMQAKEVGRLKVEENARTMSEELPTDENPSELQRIQRECTSMVKSLKRLHEEERQLREANIFLAHRAVVVMGCTAGLDGGTRRGARRMAAARKASSSPSPVPMGGG